MKFLVVIINNSFLKLCINILNNISNMLQQFKAQQSLLQKDICFQWNGDL